MWKVQKQVKEMRVTVARMGNGTEAEISIKGHTNPRAESGGGEH